MFGSLGGGEIVVILVLALLLFGPRKLPEIGRTLGKAVNQFRGASNEFRRSLEREVHLSELKETADGLKGAADEIQSDIRSVAQGAIDGPDAVPGSTAAPKPTTSPQNKDPEPPDAAKTGS